MRRPLAADDIAEVRDRIAEDNLNAADRGEPGVGRELPAFGSSVRLDDAASLRFVGVAQVGSDLRIIAGSRNALSL